MKMKCPFVNDQISTDTSLEPISTKPNAKILYYYLK